MGGGGVVGAYRNGVVMAQMVMQKDDWELWVQYCTGMPWKLVKEDEMKIGTRLVGKNSGWESEIMRFATTTANETLYLVSLVTDDQVAKRKSETWHSRESIEEKYDVLRDEVSEQKVETLEIGDIAIGKNYPCEYEVIAKEDGETIMYHRERGVRSKASDLLLVYPKHHRFYIKSNTLCVDPPLDLIEGVHDPLELSIRKWEVIVEAGGGVSDGAGSTCALCVMGEAHSDCDPCANCVVKAYTGLSQCGGTPYIAYCHYRTKASAQKMVDFLKSLRESEFKVGDLVSLGEGYPCRITQVSGSYYSAEGLIDGEVIDGLVRSDVTPLAGHYFYVRDGTLRVYPALTGKEPDPLGLSIQKWEAIVREMERGVEITGCGYGKTCALCQHNGARDDIVADCSKCPIAISAKKRDCVATPYEWWKRTKSLAAAKAELAFLRELRDGV